jgi:hypothetical protein
MPKVIPRRGTQFKRFSARVHEQSQFKRPIRKISKHVLPLVDTELNPIVSQAGSRVLNVELSIRSPNSNPRAIAVTPDSPPSPPMIKVSKKNDLFDTMSVLSGTSIDDNYNDDEEIEEVEEIQVGLCCGCRDQLKKTLHEFLLYGSVCHYCSNIVQEHVHIISRKYEATSFNCEGPNPPKPYNTKPSKASRYGIANSNSRRLEFVSITKKRNTISCPENLTCEEEIFEE